jgi:SAM-dependent methyltransferase
VSGRGTPPALSLSASLRLPLIERWLGIIDPASVLEAGCGMGAMAYRLAARFDYRGYEPDRTSYQSAARRLAALGRGEVRNEPVPEQPDRSFDLVVAFEVLEHIEDDVGALRSWVGWLGGEGHLMVSVPAHPERFGPCDRVVGHCRRYTRESLADLFASAGLGLITIESWGMPVGFMLEAVRNRVASRRLAHADVGTPGSGRIYQPPGSMGRTVELAMKPLAALQSPFRGTDRGIGYIAVARLGSAPTRDTPNR